MLSRLLQAYSLVYLGNSPSRQLSIPQLDLNPPQLFRRRHLLDLFSSRRLYHQRRRYFDLPRANSLLTTLLPRS